MIFPEISLVNVSCLKQINFTQESFLIVFCLEVKAFRKLNNLPLVTIHSMKILVTIHSEIAIVNASCLKEINFIQESFLIIFRLEVKVFRCLNNLPLVTIYSVKVLVTIHSE